MGKYFSEMFGTYLLVLIGPGSIVITSSLGLPWLEMLAVVAIAFGGIVAVVILSLGRFSGAHINPAITIGRTLAGSFNSELVLPYVAFQIAGALLAGFSLRIALGALEPITALGSTKLALGVSTIEGTILEIIGTFVLTLSALVATSYVKTPLRQALLVGGTLLVLVLLIGPLTGASFNPARSLGPSIFSGYFNNQLVYYVGPLSGAAVAGLAFRQVRSSFDKRLR
jgi:MIP family channel proteins